MTSQIYMKKKIEYLFHAFKSYVGYFIAICKFKFEL